MRASLVAGLGVATSVFVASVMCTRPTPLTPVRRTAVAPARARASTVRAVAPAREHRRERPLLRRPSVPIAADRPHGSVDIAADDELETRALDRLAQERFDAAFDAELRDDAWATETEQAIVAAIEAIDGALRIETVTCRATLCRVVLDGDREALPTTPPFDGIAWWTDGEQQRSILLLVREGAEPPLPSEPDA